jgi:hypothetical protein
LHLTFLTLERPKVVEEIGGEHEEHEQQTAPISTL